MTKETTLVSDALLTEMGQFVDETLSKESLSEYASSQRLSLIQKLCVYLPEGFPATLPSYLDMNAGASKVSAVSSVVIADREEYVGADSPAAVLIEDYECPDTSHLKLQPVVAPVSTLEEQQPLKPQISANDLKKMASKAGPLLRKERRFFVDQLRRCWAGITDYQLFFYASERETKPTNVVDLRGFQARPIPDMMKEKAKRRDACFEVVCPGKKTVQLVARTAKDMQQWVAIINEAGQQAMPEIEAQLGLPKPRRQLPSIPDDSDDSSEIYDDIMNNRVQQQLTSNTLDLEHDDEIYHDISGYGSDQESLYDDIGQIYPNSVYYNMSGQTGADLVQRVVDNPMQHQTPKEQQEEEEQEEEEEEDFYDDIGSVFTKGNVDAQAKHVGIQSEVSKGVIIGLSKNISSIQSQSRGKFPFSDIGVPKRAEVNSEVKTIDNSSSDRNSTRIQLLITQMEANFQSRVKKLPPVIPLDEEYEQVDTHHK